MIIISLGNPGSGKTATIVRDMVRNKTNRPTYTNIIPTLPKLTPHIRPIKPSMIVAKELKHTKRTGEEVFSLSLNVDYWKSINEPINVVLDEAHTIMNPRRSGSKVNIVVTDWLALIRRVLGQAASGEGELVLISQLWNRIDVVAREMATQIRYHVCHYTKVCDCGGRWVENSEMPEPLWNCPLCRGADIRKVNFRIEVWHFKNMQAFQGWKEFHMKTYYRHYFIEDIEEYFPFYNTLSWDNMFSELY